MDIAKINHSDGSDKRVVISIDKNLHLYADGEHIESPEFKNLKEVEDYVGTIWVAGEWGLEWLVEDLADLDISINLKNILNSVQIQKLLKVSRGYFWQIKKQKGFPDPIYKQGRIELWRKEDIEEYIKKKN